jgi:predicted nucleic-acid-binding protein
MGGRDVNVTADTNVLVRVFVGDDPRQGDVAKRLLERADRIALSTVALCELVWVLTRSYGIAAVDVANVIHELIGKKNVAVDRPAAEAGLAMLEAGGDFADGVIAYEGRWLGGETFVSFDRDAVRLMKATGGSARLPG